MRLNSIESYEEALRQLDSISFIEETRKTAVECEHRLHDLRADLQRRQATGRFLSVTQKSTSHFCRAGKCGYSYDFLDILQSTIQHRAFLMLMFDQNHGKTGINQ